MPPPQCGNILERLYPFCSPEQRAVLVGTGGSPLASSSTPQSLLYPGTSGSSLSTGREKASLGKAGTGCGTRVPGWSEQGHQVIRARRRKHQDVYLASSCCFLSRVQGQEHVKPRWGLIRQAPPCPSWVPLSPHSGAHLASFPPLSLPHSLCCLDFP